MRCQICNSARNVDGYTADGTPWKVKHKPATFQCCSSCFVLAFRRFGKRQRPYPNRTQWFEILSRSWDGKSRRFRCQLSNVKLIHHKKHSELTRKEKPFYPTLEHVVPKQSSGGWLVVASVINDMKSDMDLAEFRKVIALLPSCFPSCSATPIDRKSVRLLEQVLASFKYFNR